MYTPLPPESIVNSTRRPNWIPYEELLLNVNTLFYKCTTPIIPQYTQITRISLTSHRLLWYIPPETYPTSSSTSTTGWYAFPIHSISKADLLDKPIRSVKIALCMPVPERSLIHRKKMVFYHLDGRHKFTIKAAPTSAIISSDQSGDTNFVKAKNCVALDILYKTFQTARARELPKSIFLNESHEQVETSKDANYIREAGGVKGILQKHDAQLLNQREIVSDALQDLESLRRNAQEMTSLSNFLKSQLQSSTAKSDEINDIAQLLNNLGIGGGEIQSRATKSSKSTLNVYYKQLQNDLETFLEHILIGKSLNEDMSSADNNKQSSTHNSMVSNGMVLLHDLYGMFNRIRGTDMISPEDMMQAIKGIITPDKQGKFIVRHLSNNTFSAIQYIGSGDTSFSDRVFSMLKEKQQKLNVSQSAVETEITHFPFVTAVEITHALNIHYMLATVQLTLLVEEGKMCIDEQIEGVFYYQNIFN